MLWWYRGKVEKNNDGKVQHARCKMSKERRRASREVEIKVVWHKSSTVEQIFGTTEIKIF